MSASPLLRPAWRDNAPDAQLIDQNRLFVTLIVIRRLDAPARLIANSKGHSLLQTRWELILVGEGEDAL